MNNEQLSALIDDEFEGDLNIVDHLLQESHLQSTWSRYHLIGDCLRGHLTYLNDIAAPIHQSSQASPTIFQRLQQTNKSIKQIMMKPALGLAIAVSVAMLAILVVQKESVVTQTPSSAVAFNETNITPTQTSSLYEATTAPVAIREGNSIANQRLNHYLVNHNEYLSHGSVSGILPYVRIVTIEGQE